MHGEDFRVQLLFVRAVGGSNLDCLVEDEVTTRICGFNKYKAYYTYFTQPSIFINRPKKVLRVITWHPPEGRGVRHASLSGLLFDGCQQMFCPGNWRVSFGLGELAQQMCQLQRNAPGHYIDSIRCSSKLISSLGR